MEQPNLGYISLPADHKSRMSHQQYVWSLNGSFPGNLPDNSSDMEVDEYISSYERATEQ
ncbi:unnamed protein product, partial [Allacma fusca]